MRPRDILRSALESLARTKARTALTMVGIIIGILSVILVLSIGEAAQRYILDQINSFGSDIVFVQNGSDEQQNEPTLFVKQSLTFKDAKKFQLQPWTFMLTAILQQSDNVTANGLDTNATIIGTMPDQIRMNDIRVGEGAFLSDASVESHAREVVLGYKIAQNAFGNEDAVGKSVKISNTSFRVIGVMAEAGTKSFQDMDKQVYMPVTAALDLYNTRYLTYITMRTTLPINEAKQRISDVLRDQHDIEYPADGSKPIDDFSVMTQEDLIKSASTITGILQIFLSSIAAISLLVGGIGIMNIMYVTVTERTREIGLRKAIGAQPRDIMRQFLVESVIQTVLGGLVGTALGIAFAWIGITIIASFQSGWTFSVSTNGVILGFGVSALIGLCFGYFPARRAAMLSPIEALRSE